MASGEPSWLSVHHGCSPAAAAKLQSGDVIASIAGQAIGNRSDLVEAIGNKTVGEEIDISVERDGTAVDLTAKLGKRGRSARLPTKAPYIGMSVEAKSGAVVVKGVTKGSPAAKAGIEVGQTILQCGGKKIASVRDYLATTLRAPIGKPLAMKVRKGKGKAAEVTVTPTAMPQVADKGGKKGE